MELECAWALNDNEREFKRQVASNLSRCGTKNSVCRLGCRLVLFFFLKKKLVNVDVTQSSASDIPSRRYYPVQQTIVLRCSTV